MKYKILIPVFLVAATISVRAINVGDTTTYSQNFDTLASSGSANIWANNSTISGWYLFQTPAPGTAVTIYGASPGPSTGGFYSLGSSASDRALGGVGSGTFSGWIAVAFANTSGGLFNGFTANWDGEQWRNSGAPAQTMFFEYGYGNTFDEVSTWTAPGNNFDWASPVTGSPTASGIGNGTGLVSGRGGDVTGQTWANGATLWLRWLEQDDTGSDHALAIDNFTFAAKPSNVSSVPDSLPSSFAAVTFVFVLGLGYHFRGQSLHA